MPAGSNNEAEEKKNTPILIRTYGEFWSPEAVDWTKPGRLLGKRRSDSRGPDINIYEEKGVYVLYEDFIPVYVGKADKQSIGKRIQLHRDSRRKGPRWNRFSWFGVRGLTKGDKLWTESEGAYLRKDELISTLEALLIMVIDPRLNSRKEKFKNAVPLYQSETDKPIELQDQVGGLQDRLTTIEEKLDFLIESAGR